MTATTARVNRTSGRTLEERLLDLSVPEPNTGCRLWLGTASKTSDYGTFSFGAGKLRTSAHKAAYLTWKGEVPDDMHVCHACNTPMCIEPDHLYLDTSQGNHQYMADCGRGIKSIKHGLPRWVALHPLCTRHPYQGKFYFCGKQISAGYFATPQEAHEAARALREKVKAEHAAMAEAA